MDACGFCGRVILEDQEICSRCEQSMQVVGSDYNAREGDGSAAAHWFEAAPRADSIPSLVRLHSEGWFEGVFNVEGGYAGIAGQRFAQCDCNYTYGVYSPCEDCRRAPGNLQTCMAGWGDGLFPVFSTPRSDDAAAAVWAAFNSSWLQVEPWGPAWSSEFTMELSSCSPLLLGEVTTEHDLRFADAMPQTTTLVPAHGTYLIVAWIGRVPDFMPVEEGSGALLRAVALGAYSGSAEQEIRQLLAPMDETMRREIIGDLWGCPMQSVAGHTRPRRGLESEGFSVYGLESMGAEGASHPRHTTLRARRLMSEHLERLAAGGAVLRHDGSDLTRANALWLYEYEDEANAIVEALIAGGDSSAALVKETWLHTTGESGTDFAAQPVLDSASLVQSLGVQDDAAPTPTDQGSHAFRFCPSCGNPRGEGHRFCPNCGEQFPARV